MCNIFKLPSVPVPSKIMASKIKEKASYLARYHRAIASVYLTFILYHSKKNPKNQASCNS